MGETAAVETPRSWLLTLLRRTALVRIALARVRRVLGDVAMWRMELPRLPPVLARASRARAADLLYYTALLLLGLAGLGLVVGFVVDIPLSELLQVFLLGFYTLLRVTALMLIALALWLPVGILIGLRPRLAQRLQPVAQFLAAFPANLLFPIVVVAIVHWRLNPEIWLSPLMLLGAQWYILFNVIAGASAVPHDLVEAARSLQVKGLLWWRRVMLPAVFPYAITGALTAWGGAWNASIVAEAVRWGDTHLVAQGLGAYITLQTEAGDHGRIALGVMVMCLYVVVCNRLLWRPLYDTSARRFQLR